MGIIKPDITSVHVLFWALCCLLGGLCCPLEAFSVVLRASAVFVFFCCIRVFGACGAAANKRVTKLRAFGAPLRRQFFEFRP